jgi:hypothetical protein
MRPRRLGFGIARLLILAASAALPRAALAQAEPSAVRAAPSATQARAAGSASSPSAARPAPARASSRGSAAQTPASSSSGSSTVFLRDGTQARGTLLRSEPGDYVLLLQADGVRTIPWHAVERVESPASQLAARTPTQGASPEAANVSLCCADSGPAIEPEDTLDRWADVSFGWDARLEGISLFKHYTVENRSTWFSGQGIGGGVSASLHFRGPAALGFSSVRWVEFELGVGNSAHYVTWKEGVRFRTNFIENETSLIIGAHLARGRWAGENGGVPWSGVVFGLAWVPTYVYFFDNDEFESGGKLNPAGLRLTIDWGRVSPEKSGLLPGVRTFFTWLPYLGNLPTALSVGLGCVFY